LIKKNIIRRTFKSKKNPDGHQRHKAPKIQRLVTDVRLRRKRIQKDTKVKRWKKSIAATAEYSKLVDGIVAKRKSDARL
jgi:small subunit ribosomal protein S6e